MSKTKRMIYIWEENVKYYDHLDNKSDLINKFLISRQIPKQLDIETELEKKLRRIDERTNS